MHPDKIIQNYRLVRFIGDGGMGQVWLAEHTLLGRQVAMKCLHQQYTRNEAIRARFKQEAATLSHLKNDRIVALHDYIEDDEGAYLVMEFVDGIPLDDYIKDVSGPIPDAQLRDLFGQILEGFVYAHSQKVVHRDIKPGNFLVTKDGQVKILDFGIAKILGESDRKLTKTGMHMGTVYYMSPEQVKGELVDVRSDIYSLGVTLFQMATGRCPYPSDTTEFYVYDQIVNHPLPPASEFYPGVTAQIEAVIAKATFKKPDERFQNCTEFLAALNQLDFGVKDEAEVAVEGIPIESIAIAPAAVEAKSIEVPTETAAPPVENAVAEEAVEMPAPPKRRRSLAWLWILLFVMAIGGAAGYFVPKLLKKEPAKLYVSAGGVNLWRKMGSKEAGNKMTDLPFGSIVEPMDGGDDGWQKVSFKGRQGYVNAYLLRSREQFLIIDLAMDEGMKYWLNKSYLCISLAKYFTDEKLKADLSENTFKEVYGEAKGDQEVWRAKARKAQSTYNNVIRGMHLEEGKYKSDRLDDNVVIIESNHQKRRLIAFKHEKDGEGYASKVLATKDLSDLIGYEIRMGISTNLWKYGYPEKFETQKEVENGKIPIILAQPNNDEEAILLKYNGKGGFQELKMTGSF
jgi:tRNA A-37 threonylcarbamoyl transferase component Bud32